VLSVKCACHGRRYAFLIAFRASHVDRLRLRSDSFFPLHRSWFVMIQAPPRKQQQNSTEIPLEQWREIKLALLIELDVPLLGCVLPWLHFMTCTAHPTVDALFFPLSREGHLVKGAPRPYYLLSGCWHHPGCTRKHAGISFQAWLPIWLKSFGSGP
jgi:hypothetical protein